MARRLIGTGWPLEQRYGYSRAVVDGDFCFVAGTTGFDQTTLAMPPDVEQQTRNAFATIERVLDEAGFTLADVVRATYYITNAADADRMMPICGEYFRDIRPAATLVVVVGLINPDMKVEIEVTARRRTA